MQFQINYTRKITIATTQTCSVAKKKSGGSLEFNSLTSDLLSSREVVTSEYVIISDRIGSKG